LRIVLWPLRIWQFDEPGARAGIGWPPSRGGIFLFARSAARPGRQRRRPARTVRPDAARPNGWYADAANRHPTDAPFDHFGLFHHDEPQYRAGVTSLVRDALAADDPVLVAVPYDNLTLLRAPLADETERLRFADMAVAGRGYAGPYAAARFNRPLPGIPPDAAVMILGGGGELAPNRVDSRASSTTTATSPIRSPAELRPPRRWRAAVDYSWRTSCATWSAPMPDPRTRAFACTSIFEST
jgi:hypothetical protein